MATGSTVASRRSAGLITSWRHPDFLKLWLGQTVSLVGSRISEMAIPLVAVLTLNATPFEVGLLRAMQPAAWLLFGLFAGAWVDRQFRRPIMIVADSGRAILLCLIPLLAMFHHALRMDILYVIAFATGLLAVFFMIAYQSYLPTMASRDVLLARNSNLEASKCFAEIAGPSLAGVLVQLLTAPIAILADAASFLVSIASLQMIKRPERIEMKPVGEANLRQEIIDGLIFLFRQPTLRALTLFAGTANLFVNGGLALYTLYVIRELGMSAEMLGVILAIGSVGALFGAAIADWVVQRLGFGPTIVASALVAGAASLLIPLVMEPFILVVVVLMISQTLFGMALTVANVNSLTLRQVITPIGMLGRVNATQRVLVSGALPLVGALLGGGLGELIGVREALYIVALGQIAAAFWLLFSPVAAMRVLPDGQAEIE